MFIEHSRTRLNGEQREKLERLIEPPSSGRASKLAWLRSPVGAPNPRNLLALIDRLKVIREIELPPDLARSVHQNRLLQLAREGAQTDVPHLRDFETARRHGTLVAILLESTATLTDEILDMHDRIIGSAFAKAKRTYTTSFQESAKAINEKVRLYAKVGHALIEAKEADKDAFAAIEQIVPWEEFTRSVNEADKLARGVGHNKMRITNDSELADAVATASELIQAIHDYAGRDFSKKWCRRSAKVHQGRSKWRVQNAPLLDGRRTLTDCRRAVGIAHVQRREHFKTGAGPLRGWMPVAKFSTTN